MSGGGDWGPMNQCKQHLRRREESRSISDGCLGGISRSSSDGCLREESRFSHLRDSCRQEFEKLEAHWAGIRSTVGMRLGEILHPNWDILVRGHRERGSRSREARSLSLKTETIRFHAGGSLRPYAVGHPLPPVMLPWPLCNSKHWIQHLWGECATHLQRKGKHYILRQYSPEETNSSFKRTGKEGSLHLMCTSWLANLRFHVALALWNIARPHVLSIMKIISLSGAVATSGLPMASVRSRGNAPGAVIEEGTSGAVIGEGTSEGVGGTEREGLPVPPHVESVETREKVPHPENEYPPVGPSQYSDEKIKVEALFVSTSQHYTPNVFTFGYSFKPWTEYWALLSTGEVYLGLPHGDPRVFDFEEERRQNPHRFVALEKGEELATEGLYYAGRFVPFNRRAKAIAVNEEVVFRRVESWTGTKLEGTYLHNAPRDVVETSEAFGMQGATSISFKKDGTFQVQGCTNICFRERKGDGMSLPLGDSHGVYDITENVIEFRYDNGDTEDAFFFELPSSNGSIVSINGVLYNRVVKGD